MIRVWAEGFSIEHYRFFNAWEHGGIGHMQQVTCGLCSHGESTELYYNCTFNDDKFINVLLPKEH